MINALPALIDSKLLVPLVKLAGTDAGDAGNEACGTLLDIVQTDGGARQSIFRLDADLPMKIIKLQFDVGIDVEERAIGLVQELLAQVDFSREFGLHAEEFCEFYKQH